MKLDDRVSTRPRHRPVKPDAWPWRWLTGLTIAHICFGFFALSPLVGLSSVLLGFLGHRSQGFDLVEFLKMILALMALSIIEAVTVLGLESKTFDRWWRRPLGKAFLGGLGLFGIFLYVGLVGSIAEVLGLRSNEFILGILPVTVLLIFTYSAIAFGLVLSAVGTFYNADCALREVIGELPAHQLTLGICLGGMAIGGLLRRAIGA